MTMEKMVSKLDLTLVKAVVQLYHQCQVNASYGGQLKLKGTATLEADITATVTFYTDDGGLKIDVENDGKEESGASMEKTLAIEETSDQDKTRATVTVRKDDRLESVNISSLAKKDKTPPKTAKNDSAEQTPVRRSLRGRKKGENTPEEIVVKSEPISEQSEDVLVKSSEEIETPELGKDADAANDENADDMTEEMSVEDDDNSEDLLWLPNHVCKLCGKRFRRRVLLRNHINTAHTQFTNSKMDPKQLLSRVVCDVCGKTFADYNIAATHKLRLHAKKKPFSCSHCKQDFVMMIHLKKHMKKKHGGPDCGSSMLGHKAENIQESSLKDKTNEVTEVPDSRAHDDQIPDSDFEPEEDMKTDLDETNKEGTYKCSHCPKRYSFPSSLKRHIVRFHESEYKCELCGFGFLSATALHTHTITKHDANDPPVECQICKQVFTNRFMRMLHIKDTHSVMLKSEKERGKMVRFYKCDFCTKMCAHVGNLVRHKEANHNACQTCNENFEDFEALKTHCRQSAHNLQRKKTGFVVKKPTEGPNSGRKKRNAQTEPNAKAPNEPKGSVSVYPCPICGKLQKSVANRDNHIEKCHKKLVCNICGASCQGRTEFARHKRSHLAISLYRCDQCPKRFTSQAGLRYHKISHSGAWRYSCSHCEQKFTTRSQKLTHERIHTGEKPYICDVCGKAFRVMDSLNRHQTCHKNTIDDCIYPCLVCGKRFKASHTAKRHMRKVHKGLKIFPCSVCDERFCTKAELRDHSVLHADLLKDIDNISSSDLSFKSPWEKVEPAADSKLQLSVVTGSQYGDTQESQGVPAESGGSGTVVYMEQVRDQVSHLETATSVAHNQSNQTIVLMEQVDNGNITVKSNSKISAEGVMEEAFNQNVVFMEPLKGSNIISGSHKLVTVEGPSGENIVYMQPIEATHNDIEPAQVSTGSLGSVALPGNDTVVYMEEISDQGSAAHVSLSEEFNSITVPSSEAVVYMEQVISGSGGQDLVIETVDASSNQVNLGKEATVSAEIDNNQMTAAAVQLITEMMNENT